MRMASGLNGNVLFLQANREFLETHKIRLRQFGMPGNKEFEEVLEDRIIAALMVVLDVTNHPLLIHCNKGKVRRAEHHGDEISTT